MRYLYLVLALILSATTYGASRMPCEWIDFDELVYDALPYFHRLSGDEVIAQTLRKQQIALLQKCIEQYSVCIIEMPPKVSTWFSKELKSSFDRDGDVWKSDLAFGVIQYTDKKTGEQICMVAQSGDTQAVPWLSYSWVVSKGVIKKYDICSAYFHMAMTPRSLYDALLMSHKEAVSDNQWIKSYNVPKD
jgi:hypothetical protein